MQIFHCETSHADRWVMDPQHGMVKRREEVLRPSGLRSIGVAAGVYESCPEETEFLPDASGTFDVPADVAAHLLAQPGWGEGLSPFPPEETQETQAEAKPPRSGAKKTEVTAAS